MRGRLPARGPSAKMLSMTIRLDHTIVPAKDRVAAARLFAEIFGLEVRPGDGFFAQVQVNERLTLDFSDESETWEGHHYAFHVSDDEFDAIWSRVKAKQLAYGSGPGEHTDEQINTRRGGRGFYFEDPDGHRLEVMTVEETGS